MDFTVFAVRQHGATSADPPLEKRADCIDSSGHGTAAADRCSPIMYLQVLLFGVVGQLSSASSDGLPTTVTEDSGVCSGTPLSSFSAHHSLFSLVSDGLPPNLDFTVFAVRQHGATSADPPLQKRAGCMDTSGHGTAAAGRCSPIMYLQYSVEGTEIDPTELGNGEWKTVLHLRNKYRPSTSDNSQQRRAGLIGPSECSGSDGRRNAGALQDGTLTPSRPSPPPPPLRRLPCPPLPQLPRGDYKVVVKGPVVVLT
ncbi:hypothetical protein MRX96_005429 [Rhipicephalus microplus]